MAWTAVQTRLTIYVPEPLHDIFREHFATAWQQWGQQKGSNRRADGYKPQDFYQITVEPFTPTKVAELNDQYAELQAQRHQPTVKHEDAAMQDQEEGALRALQGKGSKGPAQRRSQ